MFFYLILIFIITYPKRLSNRKGESVRKPTNPPLNMLEWGINYFQ